MTSKSIVYRTIFWNTTGSLYQDATSKNPPMPGVAATMAQPTAMYAKILTT